jgi:hypothetical protein
MFEKKIVLKAFRCSEEDNNKLKLMVDSIRQATNFDEISESAIIRKAILAYYKNFQNKYVNSL